MPEAPPLTPSVVRANIQRITRLDVRGVVYVQAGPNDPVFRVRHATGSVSATKTHSGWVIVDDADQDHFWTDAKDENNFGAQTIEAVVDSLENPLSPRFVSAESLPGDRRRVVYDTDLVSQFGSLAAVHTRPHPEGREGVVELPARLTFYRYFWERQRGGIDLDRIERLHTPPDWINPALSPWRREREVEPLTAAVEGERTSEFAATFNSYVEGLYIAHATAAHLFHSYEETKQTFERCCVRYDPGRQASGWRFKPGLSLRFDEIKSLLVGEHERGHYRQLVSTPLGLLIWRCINTITSGVEYIQWKARSLDPLMIDRLPLDRWYREAGHDRLGAFDPELNDYIGQLLKKLSSINDFLAALLGRPNVTLKQFLALANAAQPELLRASDLRGPVEWKTRLDPNEPYLGASAFTVTEIIEGAARALEFGLLQTAHNSEELIAEWRKLALVGDYKPAFAYLEERLCDAPFIAIACDLALMTPIDVACASAVENVLYVEDVHPGYRLRRIAQAMQNRFWPANDKDGQRELLLDKWMSDSGLTPPKTVISAALKSKLVGPHSWGADSVVRGIPNSETSMDYLYHSLRESERAFKYRLEHPLFVVGGTMERSPFQPMIEYYTDHFVFNIEPVTKDSLDMTFKAFSMLASNTLLLALFSPRDFRQLTSAARVFKAEMDLLASRLNEQAPALDLHSIAIDLLGRELATLLGV